VAESLDKGSANDFDNWPRVTEALVKKLRSAFPQKCIGESEGLVEAHRYAGKTEMIRFLAMVMEAQKGG